MVLSCSSSAFLTSRHNRYDVFLSFRGEETRENFISHLRDALDRKGIITFADSKLRRGEKIASAIFQAIEVSAIAVIIFSKDFASSTWCLDEVAKIIECHEDYGQIVIPVFYHVNPADVRNQGGTFAEAFVEHGRYLKNQDKVQRWKAALTKTANLAGWDSQVTRPDSKLLDEIVKDVFKRSKQEPAYGLEGLAATNSHTPLIKTVSIELSDGRSLTIWDMDTTTRIRAGLNYGTTTTTASTSTTTNGTSRTGGVFSSSTSNRHPMHRTGTSRKLSHRAEEFTFEELASATNHFSQSTTLGAGGFGFVYKGTLRDGRQVAIKKGAKDQEFRKMESEFDSELASLSRLHHKHVVSLLGYCQDGDERLLVFEYMKNGGLHDHLHEQNNIEKCSSVINTWKMRIKIALDTAKAIEYLHDYAVPPIIHRDIKSANILLDTNWTARLCDFGLSLVINSQSEFGEDKVIAGTMGYFDPECFKTKMIALKSDVFSFGVVLPELLTGKRVFFEDCDNRRTQRYIADFAVPRIMANEFVKILDPRVSPPELNEAKALLLVAHTAMFCVKSEGKERPTIAEVVTSLQLAVSLCGGCHDRISSGISSSVEMAIGRIGGGFSPSHPHSLPSATVPVPKLIPTPIPAGNTKTLPVTFPYTDQGSPPCPISASISFFFLIFLSFLATNLYKFLT